MKHTAYIGLGSNLGDKIDNLTLAIGNLSQNRNIKILALSEWYKTDPITVDPFEKQPKYMNGVAKIETSLDPHKLLKKCQEIEASMGRVYERKKWSPRIIDLDILFYDDLIMNDRLLKIPHPEIPKRLFVLIPMCDIAPTFVHPAFGETMKEMATNLKFRGLNKTFSKEEL